ncbi:MAG: PAS domain-containing protein [Cyclobacteriaceae bacterium]
MNESENNQRLIKTYIDISPLAYNVYDLVKDILVISTKDSLETIGIAKSELIQMSHDYYKEIIHPDDYEIVKANFLKMKQASLGDKVDQVFRVRHGKGHYVWLHTIYKIFEADEQGQPTKMAGVAEDITRLKTVEADLKNAVDILMKVRHRDAHLLRAPVVTILGLLNVLDEENLIQPPNQAIFDYLKITVEKLDSLVVDIYKNSSM